MLPWFKARTERTTTARQLYGSSVAAARNPALFRDICVADTMEGRYEMVVLHVGLLVRRLTAAGEQGKALGQAVLEEMVTALDDDFRELGVSDLRVGKKVQAAASAFYGRMRAYDQGLQSPDPAALTEALARNVPASGEGPLAADRLAAYVRATETALNDQPVAALCEGKVLFHIAIS
jgi:cytochrome b pre-mRNA-processing protein 3